MNSVFATTDSMQIVLMIVAIVAGLLQALVLFILRDIKSTLKGLVLKDLCNEKHKTVNRRLGILENQVNTSGVRRISDTLRE